MSSKVSELAGLGDDELQARLDEASQELFNLRFQVVTGQLDNTARIGQVRRDIARVKTLLRAREIDRFPTAGIGADQDNPNEGEDEL